MIITFEDVVATACMTVVFAIMGWAFLWAAEKEDELGISGMSSERILVQEEIKNSKPIAIKNYDY